MKLISKIADIDGEIQELVHESKLPVLNKLLDNSNDLYIERIAELEAKSEVLKYANEGLGFEIIELEKENASLNDQNKRVCTEVAELEKEREKANFAVVPRKLTKGMRIAYHESIERHEDCEEVIGCPDDQWAVMIKQYESEALKEKG
jgi:hypothetical protein